MRQVFEYRLNMIYVQFSEIFGFICVKFEGVFYLFFNVKVAVENCGFKDVDEYVKVFLEEEKVVIVLGLGFGLLDNVCLFYVMLFDFLEEVVERICCFMEKYS